VPTRVAGCRGFDPNEDTESCESIVSHVVDENVAGDSIRTRILKDAERALTVVRWASCRGFDPNEDTERFDRLRLAVERQRLQGIRSERGY